LDKYNKSRPPSELIKTVLINDLNRIIQGKSLWDEQLFRDVILTKKTDKLTKENSQKQKDTIRLNRLLLEEAYQYEMVMSEDVRKPIKFLNLEIYKEYFSLVYGILFGIFILILFLRMRCLKVITNRIKKENVELFRFFPWITSPFHKLTLGLILFFVSIGLGFIELGKVTRGHLFQKCDNKFLIPWLYQAIGYVDAVVFILGVIGLIYIFIYIRSIRKNLGHY
jgi:hypothetical protein